MASEEQQTIGNESFELAVQKQDRRIAVRLRDRASGLDAADGEYVYRAVVPWAEGQLTCERLQEAEVRTSGSTLTITGGLAGLVLTHTFEAPEARPIIEERLLLHNPTDVVIRVQMLACGMAKRVANHVGHILPELREDRFVAIPFRHFPTDSADFDVDFVLANLLRLSGREHRVNTEPLTWPQYGHVPCDRWASEGWAWVHGERCFGIFKLNQQAMEFSVLSMESDASGVALRFGGAATHAADPSCLSAIAPGQCVELGLTRYQSIAGHHREAAYAFRELLDQQGCRFPRGYDPPIHWNELYDNPEWNLATPGRPAGRRMTRPVTYTKALMEEEARKAREYSCQSLYLDPGWDTDFGTFLWGERWLGPRKEFVEAIRSRYGLAVSLHCPLATWMSLDGRAVSSWPGEALIRREDGSPVQGAFCLASRQYLEEAERRLAEHCADGVAFLMFDGNWWGGSCWSPDHGHPVPSAKEDHVRANLELARRVHARFPDVLIEMHDMVTGGTVQRYTPVYYKYGLEGSYDENWGFELMWQPMEDIKGGRARSLYYYNLACNVPLYLHVDLRDDNEHCVVLWWYASTCRHLGIGGTHPRPAVAQAQRHAMQSYRRLERFYKQGEFWGMHEEAHVHALPDQNAFVVNLFNLSDQERVVEGNVTVRRMGLDPNRWYVTPKGARFDPSSGEVVVRRRLPAWGAEVLELPCLDQP